MPVTSITIKNASGKVLAQPTRSFTVRAGTQNDMKITMPAEHIVNLSVVTRKSVYEKAFEQLRYEPYLTHIGVVGPDDDGNVWINGDRCTSWSVGTDDVETQHSEDRRHYSVEKGGTITLWDMCPACNTCDNALRLKKLFEWCKQSLNTLKDVNLYDSDTCRARSAYLEDKNIVVPANCKNCGKDKLVLDSKQLLGQYATVVHMWNYIVSRNNCSTEIAALDGDPSGMSIQTKRSIPSCNSQSSIQCHINVKLISSGTSGISVYVPDPVLEFKPFSESSTVSSDQCRVTHTSVTEKDLETTFNPVTVAGTYFVNMKLLPFKYVKLTDTKGNVVKLTDIAWDADKVEYEDAEGYLIEKLLLGVTADATTVQQPTAEQYKEGKTYPSRAVDGVSVWQVTVTWIWSGATDQDIEDTYTYMFETANARDFVDGLFVEDGFAKAYIDDAAQPTEA